MKLIPIFRCLNCNIRFEGEFRVISDDKIHIRSEPGDRLLGRVTDDWHNCEFEGQMGYTQFIGYRVLEEENDG